MKLDKRLIWLIYAVFLTFPILNPLGLPISIDPITRETFNYVNNIPPGTTIAIFDNLGAGTLPELYPITKALIQHLFERSDIKLVFINLNVQQTMWREKLISEIDVKGYEYGKDYVYLGYTPGGLTAISMMADDLPALVSVDFYGTPFNELPDNGAIMEGIKNAEDFDLLIVIAGSAYSDWLGPWSAKYGIPTLIGGQMVNVPETLVYWDADQIIGLIKGQRGCAEYEILLGKPGDSVVALDAQSMAHTLVISLIIIGNVKYHFFDKKNSVRGA